MVGGHAFHPCIWSRSKGLFVKDFILPGYSGSFDRKVPRLRPRVLIHQLHHHTFRIKKKLMKLCESHLFWHNFSKVGLLMNRFPWSPQQENEEIHQLKEQAKPQDLPKTPSRFRGPMVSWPRFQGVGMGFGHLVIWSSCSLPKSSVFLKIIIDGSSTNDIIYYTGCGWASLNVNAATSWSGNDPFYRLHQSQKIAQELMIYHLDTRNRQ